MRIVNIASDATIAELHQQNDWRNNQQLQKIFLPSYTTNSQQFQ